MKYSMAKVFSDELIERIPMDCLYHSRVHIEGVAKAAVTFAKSAKMPPETVRLIEVAARFHDLGYIKTRAGHEEVSAAIAAENLPRFGFSPAETTRICEMILATKMPTSPRSPEAQILCDADIEYIGRGDFLPLSYLLRLELAAEGREFTEKEWLAFEIKFLEKVKFYSAVARRLRGSGVRRNLQKLYDFRQALETASHQP